MSDVAHNKHHTKASEAELPCRSGGLLSDKVPVGNAIQGSTTAEIGERCSGWQKGEMMSQRFRINFQIFFCKIFPRPLCIIGSCV